MLLQVKSKKKEKHLILCTYGCDDQVSPRPLLGLGHPFEKVESQDAFNLLEAGPGVLFGVGSVRNVRRPAHRERREEAVQILEGVDRLAGQHDVAALVRLGFRRMRRIPEVHQLRNARHVRDEGHTLGVVVTAGL